MAPAKCGFTFKVRASGSTACASTAQMATPLNRGLLDACTVDSSPVPSYLAPTVSSASKSRNVRRTPLKGGSTTPKGPDNKEHTPLKSMEKITRRGCALPEVSSFRIDDSVRSEENESTNVASPPKAKRAPARPAMMSPMRRPSDEDVNRRWIEYYVSKGRFDEARKLGWSGAASLQPLQPHRGSPLASPRRGDSRIPVPPSPLSRARPVEPLVVPGDAPNSSSRRSSLPETPADPVSLAFPAPASLQSARGPSPATPQWLRTAAVLLEQPSEGRQTKGGVAFFVDVCEEEPAEAEATHITATAEAAEVEAEAEAVRRRNRSWARAVHQLNRSLTCLRLRGCRAAGPSRRAGRGLTPPARNRSQRQERQRRRWGAAVCRYLRHVCGGRVRGCWMRALRRPAFRSQVA